jgi:hypothetical protein
VLGGIATLYGKNGKNVKNYRKASIMPLWMPQENI